MHFKEFKDAEYLGVVQAALDDVFLFFDEIAAKLANDHLPDPAERQ